MNAWLVAALAGAAFAAATPAFAMAPARTVETPKGPALATAKGMTLYTFDMDSTNKSNCTEGCAYAWHPFRAAAKASASGAWTLIKRRDGSRQWAYDGKPLYTWRRDKKPGDITGDGFDGVWHMARP